MSGIIKSANFIVSAEDYGDICPVFRKKLVIAKPVKSAQLSISALGLYECRVNGNRVGEYIFAPGWTEYYKRLQYQTYDLGCALGAENLIEITAGKGWCVGRLAFEHTSRFWSPRIAVIACVEIIYEDGTSETLLTDETWESAKSGILTSEIYDGETFDARIEPSGFAPSVIFEYSKDVLIPQEGEEIREIETLPPVKRFTAPNGEYVVDFGQNMTGYVKVTFEAPCGEYIDIDHAETLDAQGNFYTKNLRTAKQKIIYYSNGNKRTYYPRFSFQGFRYIRVNHFPADIENIRFEAVAVHSQIKRTGHFECSSKLVNQLYSNSVWSQRDNYLDVPTDCPQRDERLGWTGDAQIFAKTATYHFDVEKFFSKWLHDVAADQRENGGIPSVVPDVLREKKNYSACWGDAAVICPWQVYLTYGNKKILAEQFDCMQRWVEHMRSCGDNEYLWNTGEHYGDWCALDSAGITGATKGATSQHFIATAFYAYSTSLLVKAGEALGKDMSFYKELHKKIKEAFNETYVKDGALTSNTQTAHVLALHFDLVDDKPLYAARLAKMITDNGNKLQTGFAGTGYLLDALTENGYEQLAYTLLLQDEFPSWLFSVRMGATTIWEHWDGMREDGTMWSTAMNSFNHYAYGSVASWMYETMAGIKRDERAPGFKHFVLKPVTDKRIEYVKASLDTRHGTIKSEWKNSGGTYEYYFEIPENTTADIYVNGTSYQVSSGIYKF